MAFQHYSHRMRSGDRFKHARHRDDLLGGDKWDHTTHGPFQTEHRASGSGPFRRAHSTVTDAIAPIEAVGRDRTAGIRMRCAVRLHVETVSSLGSPWLRYTILISTQSNPTDLANYMPAGFDPSNKIVPFRVQDFSTDFNRYRAVYTEYRISKTWLRWRLPQSEELGQVVTDAGIHQDVFADARLIAVAARTDLRVGPHGTGITISPDSYILSNGSTKVAQCATLVRTGHAFYQELHLNGLYDDIWFPTGYFDNSSNVFIANPVLYRTDSAWTAGSAPSSTDYARPMPGPWLQFMCLDLSPPTVVLPADVLTTLLQTDISLGNIDVGFDLEFRHPVPANAGVGVTPDKHGSAYEMFEFIRDAIRRLEESGTPPALLQQLPVWALWQDLQSSAADFARLEQDQLQQELDLDDLELVDGENLVPRTPGLQPPSQPSRPETPTPPRLQRSDAQAGIPRTRTLGTTRRGEHLK